VTIRGRASEAQSEDEQRRTLVLPSSSTFGSTRTAIDSDVHARIHVDALSSTAQPLERTTPSPLHGLVQQMVLTGEAWDTYTRSSKRKASNLEERGENDTGRKVDLLKVVSRSIALWISLVSTRQKM
jgi:hypothetical protein